MTAARAYAVLAAAAMLAAASDVLADIYTWVDKDGIVNVSNLPPPDEAKILRTTRTAPRDPARDAAREAQVRALSARVAQLESEVDAARREAAAPVLPPPPPVVVVAPPAPTTSIVNVVMPAAQAPAYAPYADGCDISFGDCLGTGWGYYGVPGAVVVGGRPGGKPGRRHGPYGQAPAQTQIVPPLIPLPQSTFIGLPRRG